MSVFSDEFIQNQQQILQDQKTSIVSELEKLKMQDPFSDPDHAIDNAAIDTDVREQSGHEVIQAEMKLLRERLEDIEHALRKIEKGTYGYCERTNKPIPEARLRIVPEARYCVEE